MEKGEPNMNRFHIFEMAKEDAFWFEDKVRNRVNFQIGPLDSVTRCSEGVYLIDDNEYQVTVILNKKDSKRIDKYFEH